MHKMEVIVTLPRFEMSSKSRLRPVLSDLGMPLAFGQSADFSGMNGERDLFISSVIHQANVKVDEEGTVAEAATAVIMNKRAMKKPAVFKADHPFVFLIRDNGSGSILFMGRLVDPR